MTILAEHYQVSEGDVHNAAIDYQTRFLRGTEVIADVQATEIGTSELDLSGIAPSSTQLEIKGRLVEAGKAALLTITGFVKATRNYVIDVQITTNQGQIAVDTIHLEVR